MKRSIKLSSPNSLNLVVVRTGDKYPETYLKLFPGAIVLNDERLLCGFPGWWAKMELFAPWNRDIRPCLYVDLDSFIMEMPKFGPPEKLMMCREWMPGMNGAQSSVMLIPKEVDHIWEHFIQSPQAVMDQYGGDQDYLNTFDWEPIPEGVVGSYRLHNQVKPVHKIITFHGKPKPHEATGWAKEEWSRRLSL